MTHRGGCTIGNRMRLKFYDATKCSKKSPEDGAEQIRWKSFIVSGFFSSWKFYFPPVTASEARHLSSGKSGRNSAPSNEKCRFCSRRNFRRKRKYVRGVGATVTVTGDEPFQNRLTVRTAAVLERSEVGSDGKRPEFAGLYLTRAARGISRGCFASRTRSSKRLSSAQPQSTVSDKSHLSTSYGKSRSISEISNSRGFACLPDCPRQFFLILLPRSVVAACVCRPPVEEGASPIATAQNARVGRASLTH